MAFGDYLRHRGERLDGAPMSDFPVALIQAEHEGTRLSLDEWLANVLLVLSAGNETTTCLLGSALAAGRLKHRDNFKIRCPRELRVSVTLGGDIPREDLAVPKSAVALSIHNLDREDARLIGGCVGLLCSWGQVE